MAPFGVAMAKAHQHGRSMNPMTSLLDYESPFRLAIRLVTATDTGKLMNAPAAITPMMYEPLSNPVTTAITNKTPMVTVKAMVNTMLSNGKFIKPPKKIRKSNIVIQLFWANVKCFLQKIRNFFMVLIFLVKFTKKLYDFRQNSCQDGCFMLK